MNQEKKVYEEPVVEIIEFETEDVIKSSSTTEIIPSTFRNWN